jgi:hypothetical protein
MKKQIHFTVDDHDREQLMLLAKISKIRLSEMLRRIVKAYLDRRKLP